MPSDDVVRAEFEQWASDNEFILRPDVDGGSYYYLSTRNIWEAWQAALATRQPPPANDPVCFSCGAPAQPKLTINLQPVCTACVTSGAAFGKEGKTNE